MPQKPHWPLGLDLGPHVFQAQDRYHEELIAERFATLFDHAWGISELEWDPRALAGGHLVATRLRAVFPDGTVVSCDASDLSSCPTKAVRDLQSRPAVEVYLAFPRAGAVAADGKTRVHRYTRQQTVVTDFATGEDPTEVEWLRPNLELLLEGERLDRHTTLPCARLTRTAAGALALDPQFVPPILTIAASPFIDAEVRRIADELAARKLALRHLPARTGNDAARQLLMSVLGGFIPRLTDAVERRVHPHHVYRILAEALGALAAFTPEGSVEVPPFDYEHLSPVFLNLFRALQGVIDALGAEHYKRIALLATDASTLYAELKEPGIFRNDFYISVQGDDVERLRGDVPRIFKIAAWNDLARIIASHSKGVSLEPLISAPAALPNTPGAVYFRMEKNEAFTSIYKTGELGIHHAGLPGVREIAFFAVDAPGQ